MHNCELGICVAFEYSSAELPELIEWKNCLTGSYALGIEPANVSLEGRNADIKSGKVRRMKPYESVKTQLKISFKNAASRNVIISRRSSTTTADTSRSPFSVLNRGRRKNRSWNVW